MGKHQDFLDEERDEQNLPLIRRLRTVYQPDQQDAFSLARTRQRLLSGDYQSKNMQQNQYEGMNSTMKTFKSHRPRRVLIASAAILSIALVISFIVVTLSLTQHPSQTTAPTPTAVVKPTRPVVTRTPTPILPHTPTNVSAVHMVDSTIGWALCVDGSVLRTTDGGLNWSDVTPPALFSFKSHAVDGSLFSDGSTAWIVVMTSLSASFTSQITSFAFHTSDAGQSWQEGMLGTNESTVTTDPVYQVVAISSQEAWAQDTHTVGGSGSGPELYGMSGLFHTTDSGKTWVQPQNLPNAELFSYYPAISFADQHTGIITGSVIETSKLQPAILLTHDDGASWRSIKMLAPASSQWTLTSLFSPQFLTSHDAVVSALYQNGSYFQGTRGFSVFSTHDGGETWSSSPIIDLGANFLPIYTQFFDAQHASVFVSRDKWYRYVSNDGGQQWSQIALNPPGQVISTGGGVSLPDFTSLMTGSLLTVSQPGGSSSPTSFYTTADGGVTWVQVHAHFPSFITPKSAY